LNLHKKCSEKVEKKVHSDDCYAPVIYQCVESYRLETNDSEPLQTTIIANNANAMSTPFERNDFQLASKNADLIDVW
jgi:hypothetical protein